MTNTIFQCVGHLQVRLKNYDSDMVQSLEDYFTSNRQETNKKLLRWLERLQFKMGQIELQSCNITQFYSI